ncbi:coiled-coil domain-containing protein 158-like [Physella acuta]|uniref:coiled-coil domain-containing protein 158-like n=1 Tax=Physella acuta TaxID=109671 RepID=UPI0027DDA5DD|nr:coiled-coil domain-containing protein 158-like [Physella acuta]
MASPFESAPHTDHQHDSDLASSSSVTVTSKNGGQHTDLQSDLSQNPSHSYDRRTPSSDEIKRPSSVDFAEQIRRLEIEGNKLRAATISNLGSHNGFSMDNSFEVPKVNSYSYGNLSALVDFSADQKCIADLRIQLENQRKETERLQRQLLGDNSGFRPMTAPVYSNTANGTLTSHFSQFSNSPGKSAFSTIPSGELVQALTRRNFDSQPPPHLESLLKDSQSQVNELKKKLQEVTDSSDQEKRHFRTTLEELKTKLHDTIVNRDAVLDLRQKESNTQEMLIHKLQAAVTQLQDQCRTHEEALSSASKKFESCHQSNYINETALTQIRSILMDREKRQGRLYFEADPVSGQSINMLVHTLERCLQDLDHDITLKSFKITELEDDLSDIKKSFSEKERALTKDGQEMVAMVTKEQERNLAIANEKAVNAMRQIGTLQAQLENTESTYKYEIKTKEREIKELEEQLIDMKTETMKTAAIWQEKLIQSKQNEVYIETMRQALEASLDEVQRELIETKAEKNELLRSLTTMEKRADSLQIFVSQLETDLETEKEHVKSQRQREEELRSEVMNLEVQVSNKQNDVERLERMLSLVKQECSLQVKEQVAGAEKVEREHFVDQIKHLSAQLATMTEKCSRLTVELQMAKSERESNRSQVQDLSSRLETTRSQIESSLAEKTDLTNMLADRLSELDRLYKDKEHYLKLSEQKNNEVMELKIALESLKTQVEEKEKVLCTFREQSSSISHLMEVNTKASDNIREERDKMAAALTEKEAILVEMKASHDSLLKKLKAKEKKQKDAEEEVLKTTDALAKKTQELEAVEKERDHLASELKDASLKVSTLTSSKDAIKKELVRVRGAHAKEISKLQTKLKDSDQEKKLSMKALRSKDIMDNKAIKLADKVQKEITDKRSEIDQLMTKVHRLEEKLEAAHKEKQMVEKDKSSLKRGLAKSLQQNQELSNQLQALEEQNNNLMAQLSQLEELIEQKSSAFHSKTEKHEQELATLKIKHQLDLKEMERTARNKGRNLLSAGNGLPTLSGKSSAQVVQKKPTTSLGSGESVEYSNGTDLLTSKHNNRQLKMSTEVGKDLKLLLGEMKNLISGHREDNEYFDEKFKAQTERKPALKDAHKPKPAALDLEDLRVTGETKHADHLSSGKQGDVTDGFPYTEWRPRSYSLTRPSSSPAYDPSHTLGSTFHSKDNYSDISRLSQSLGSPKKQNGSINLVPDTQELCRRLEEKIESLTRMGGNLIKENKDMEDLINLQGRKLDNVRQIEKLAWEKR